MYHSSPIKLPTMITPLIIIILVTSGSSSMADSVIPGGGGSGLQSVLSELERISHSLKGIEQINEKLISNLRENATRYGFKSRTPEEFAQRGYACIGGVGWFKYYRDEVSWNEARKSCRKDDAHLAVPNSEAEALALKNLLLENYQFSAYIGIHNQFKEDEWVTVFGDPLGETGYNRWSVGPPKISEANCGVLFEDAKLLGIPCRARRSYFCEIPGIPAC